MTSRNGLPPLTEQGKQERYVQWLFVIAEARAAIKRHAGNQELLAIQARAAECLRGISPKWVATFQLRRDYSDRVKEAMGDDLGHKTLTYLRSLNHPFEH